MRIGRRPPLNEQRLWLHHEHSRMLRRSANARSFGGTSWASQGCIKALRLMAVTETVDTRGATLDVLLVCQFNAIDLERHVVAAFKRTGSDKYLARSMILNILLHFIRVVGWRSRETTWTIGRAPRMDQRKGCPLLPLGSSRRSHGLHDGGSLKLLTGCEQ